MIIALNNEPLNSLEWPKQHFSLQYQYNIQKKSNENKEEDQLGDYLLIQYQILWTNIIRIVWQIVRRITDAILKGKGLKGEATVSKQYMNSCWFIFFFFYFSTQFGALFGLELISLSCLCIWKLTDWRM